MHYARGSIQPELVDVEQEWEKLWVGMPEYVQEDHMPWQTVKVHLRNEDDRRAFAELMGQTITNKTGYMWYPASEKVRVQGVKSYANRDTMTPRYPVYVISKSRWETRQTSKALEARDIPYHIVVEPVQYDEYAAVIDPSKILVLPDSNLGQGSIPARNFVWDHADSLGGKRHWILDDNICGFYRLNRNLKVPVDSGATFRAVEDFADRYDNVALAGMNYCYLAKRKQLIPPFLLNTRIYSCILIQNDIPYRWRGMYNEDTDLSLRALKDGYCTVLFSAFLADKVPTLTMKGGNADELYQGDGRRLMAESLRDQHPDVVRVSQKWGRVQHHVDYRPFKGNRLIPTEGVAVDTETNNYGMELVTHGDDEGTDTD